MVGGADLVDDGEKDEVVPEGALGNVFVPIAVVVTEDIGRE